MTQQPLPLDQFESVRVLVYARSDVLAYQAAKEISERIEFERRSLGQRTRRDIERIGR